MPLFVDTFGSGRNKSVWMAMMLLAPSLGVISGYIMTAICIMKVNWRFSFGLQSALSLIMAGVVAVTPSEYLELSHVQIALQAELQKRK